MGETLFKPPAPLNMRASSSLSPVTTRPARRFDTYGACKNFTSESSLSP